jgi:MFS family permease
VDAPLELHQRAQFKLTARFATTLVSLGVGPAGAQWPSYRQWTIRNVTQPLPETARFAALRSRNFTLLFTGLIVSNTGTWMQNVASGWLVLQLTNSPLWLGLLGLSFALPMCLLPLFAGAVVDRVHRIRLLYLTQTLQMLTAFALAALTWLGLINVWHVLASQFIIGVLLAFDNPARQSLIPDLVERRDLLNALSLNSATYNGAALVGPALAGALLAPLGAGTLFFLNGVSYLAVLMALLAMRDVPVPPSRQHASLWASAWQGMAYALRSRVVLGLLLLSAVASLFGRSYQVLLPIFARDIWHSGPQAYGLLLGSAGAGALVGAFGLAAIRNVRRHNLVMLASGLLFSVALIAFAVSPSLPLGIALVFVAGVTSTVLGTMIATFLQVDAPPELRGRVMSLYAITLIGLPSLGALGTGAAAEQLGGIAGAPRAVLVSALLLIVVVVAFAPFFIRQDRLTTSEIPAGRGPSR